MAATNFINVCSASSLNGYHTSPGVSRDLLWVISGHFLLSAFAKMMSALPPKADIHERNWNVRFVPEADISANLFCQLKGHRAETVALQINPIERVEFRQLSD
jgi:hypothetical protein